MDRINQIWPAWHTVELIGRGAFGEVYKAKREELGETFYSAVSGPAVLRLWNLSRLRISLHYNMPQCIMSIFPLLADVPRKIRLLVIAGQLAMA